MIGVGHDNIARLRIGDHMLEIRQIDIFLDLDELASGVGRDYLPMIRICEAPLSRNRIPIWNQFRQNRTHGIERSADRMLLESDANVKVGPPRIHITMQTVEQRRSLDSLPCLEKFPRRAFHKHLNPVVPHVFLLSGNYQLRAVALLMNTQISYKKPGPHKSALSHSFNGRRSRPIDKGHSRQKELYPQR